MRLESPHARSSMAFVRALTVSGLWYLLAPALISPDVISVSLMLMWAAFSWYISTQLVRLMSIRIEPDPVGIRAVAEHFRACYSSQKLKRRSSGALLLLFGMTHVALSTLFFVDIVKPGYLFPMEQDLAPYLGVQVPLVMVTVCLACAYRFIRSNTQRARKQLVEAECRLPFSEREEYPKDVLACTRTLSLVAGHLAKRCSMQAVLIALGQTVNALLKLARREGVLTDEQEATFVNSIGSNDEEATDCGSSGDRA